MLGLLDMGILSIIYILLIFICIPLLLTFFIGMAVIDFLGFSGILGLLSLIFFYILVVIILSFICY